MGSESGYLGNLSVEQSAGVSGVGVKSRISTIDSDGNPIYTPYNEEAWANELKADDGNFRFLKNGAVVGRGASNCFDTIFQNNFTVITLAKPRKFAANTVLNSLWSKGLTIEGVMFNPCGIVTSGSMDYQEVLSNSYTHTPFSGTTSEDKNWHWYSVTKAGATVSIGVDGKFYQQSNLNAVLNANSSSFKLDSAYADIACVMVFSRVLSNAEIINIISGNTKPKNTDNLEGYYKLNEGAAYGPAATNQGCLDSSGKGNHLNYSSTTTWEMYSPAPSTELVINGGFTSIAGWFKTTAGVTIASNKMAIASSTPAGNGISQTSIIESYQLGTNFVLSFDILACNCADNANYNFTINVGMQTVTTIRLSNANHTPGHYTIPFTRSVPSGNTPGRIAVMCGYMGATIEITNLSVTTSAIPVLGQGGQPYVNRQLLDTTKWYNRRPPASVLAALQGSIGKVGAGGSITATTNAAYDYLTDLTFCAWHKQNGKHDLDYGDLLIDLYGFFGSFSVAVAGFGAEVSITYGTIDAHTFALSKPIPYGAWVFVALKVSGGIPTLYLNATTVGSGNAFTSDDAGHENTLFIREEGYCDSHVRSLRLFGRAISDAEIEELFMTDAITNRTGLVAEFMCNELATVDAIPVLKDTSPIQNHSSAIGTTPLLLDSPYAANRPKRRGKQLRLSGTGGISGMRIDFPAALKTAIAAAPILTFSVWVKAKGANALAVATGAEIFAEIFVLSDGAGIQAEGVTAGEFTEYPMKTLKGLNQLGVWCLYSIEVNTITNMEYAYKNGVLVSVVNDSGQASTAGTFAADRLYGEAPFATIDSVRLYNRSLTAAEHRALFFDQAPRDGLLCEYLFDVDTSSCLDSSGNNHHGTWNGITAASYVCEQ